MNANKIFISIGIIFLGFNNSIFAQRYLEMIDQGSFTLKEIQSEAEHYFDEVGKGRGSGYKQYIRWEYNARINQDKDGFIPKAPASFERMQEYNRDLNHQLFSRSNDCAGDWRELGPTKVIVTSGYNPGIGRITSIAIDPSDNQHIIIGGQSGGVWQTIDGGENWIPLTDELACLETYSLCIDAQDPDVYYWGGRDGLLLISNDKGSTWANRSIPDAGIILSINIQPSTGDLWASSSYGGLFRLRAGEEEWSMMNSEICDDIKFHPENDSLVYASGIGLWISKDNGATFENADSVFFTKGVVMMAVSAMAPDHLYALQADGNRFGGLYVSRDRGLTFDTLQTDTINYFGYDVDGRDESGQAPRDMDIVVSDLDTNQIFVGGINLWRSLNGGKKFEIVSHWYYDEGLSVAYNHADIDMLLMDENDLYIASDGGIYLMDDPAAEISASAIRDLSEGLGIHQFYRIGLVQSEEVIVSGGSQDNGSNILKDGQWHHWMGADGMETFFIGDEESAVLFGTTQWGGLSLSDNFGESRHGIPGLSTLQGNGSWITPFIKDAEGENIYVAFDAVYRSQDFGFNFDTISQVLFLEHLVCAPTGNDTIYGAAFNNLYRTTNGGATDWDTLSEYGDLEVWWIEGIAVHPKDANLIALAVQGNSTVIVSRDGGNSWEGYGEGLPNFPIRTLVWQDDDLETLYVGTNFGVYKRENSDPHWMPFSFGLPNAIINDLQINTVTNELYAATYGRGLWVTPLCQQNVGVDDELDESIVSIGGTLLRTGQTIDIISEELIKANIGVYQLDGRPLYFNTKVNLSEQLSIPTYGWTSGFYIVRIETSKGYRVFKIILQ